MTHLSPLQQDLNDPLALSCAMLNAAQRGKWERLITLNDRYLMMLRSAMENTLQPDSPQAERLAEVIAPLISNEKKIRELVHKHMERLQGDILHLHHIRQGTRAYAAQMMQPVN